MPEAYILGAKPAGGWSFGITGRELMAPVLGFRVQADCNAITHIENILATTATSQRVYGNPLGSYEFLLMDSEHVARVVYSLRGNPGVVQAIRFETNLRVSQWFGNFQGNDQRHLAAPDGYCIHSICGQIAGEGYFTLGAVVWRNEPPREDATEPVSKELQDKCVIAAEVSTPSYAFHSSVGGEVGAVLVQFNGQVFGIDAVSKSEYQRFVALLSHVSLPLNDYVVELVANEAIVGIEYCVQNETLMGLRLETNRRHTPWIGQCPAGYSKHGAYRCTSGGHICGFFASPSDKIGLGVVVASPRSAAKEET